MQHYHQAVAVVVARTFEEARAAASKIKVRYAAEPGAYDLAKAKDAAQKPPAQFGTEPDSAAGDFNGAFAAAPVKLDATYTTPDQTHAMMEPFASIAAWKGDELTVWTANQMIAWARGDLAKTLQDGSGQGARGVAVHRWRLRRQALPALGCAAGSTRSAGREAAGESGAPAPADG